MNILITYAGGIAGQSIIKSLKNSKYSKKIKIVGIDCDKNSPSLKWVDVGLVCPKSQTPEYELYIRNLIVKENINLYSIKYLMLIKLYCLCVLWGELFRLPNT